MRWLGNASRALAKMSERISPYFNHDFCPWANRYVYWLKSPLGWLGLGFLASILLGISVSGNAFFATAGIAAIALIGCVWPYVAMYAIRGELIWDSARCEEGQEVGVTLRVTNRWPWPVWGLAIEFDREGGNENENIERETIALSCAPALAATEFTWRFKATSRGLYPKNQVKLVTAFPFGIWSHGVELHVPRKLIVWPMIVKLMDVPVRPGSMRSLVGTSGNQVGQDGDWTGVRPFRDGDSLRQVHWAQSASRDQLIVFERQTTTQQHVELQLDGQGGADCKVLEQREWLIRVTASLACHFLAHAWNVHCWLGNKELRLQPGSIDRYKLLDELATYEWPDSHEESLANRVRGGWPIRITTAERAKAMELSPNAQNTISSSRGRSSDCHWFLVDSEVESPVPSSASRTNQSKRQSILHVEASPGPRLDATESHVPSSVVTQFKTCWQALCQANS